MKQDRLITVLEQWLAKVKNGEITIDWVSQDADVGDVAAVGTHMPNPLPTGVCTMKIKYRVVGLEDQFHAQYEANRLDGVPVFLDDLLRSRVITK